MVAASSPSAARKLAAAEAGTYGNPEEWLDTTATRCRKVGEGQGPARVILSSYQAG